MQLELQLVHASQGIDKRYIENYIYLNQDVPVLDKYIFKLRLRRKP
jgi:hypothetical protein